jgi:hypothetical protein
MRHDESLSCFHGTGTSSSRARRLSSSLVGSPFGAAIPLYGRMAQGTVAAPSGRSNSRMIPQPRLTAAALLLLAGHSVHGPTARAASSSEAVRANRWAEEVVTAVGARRSRTTAKEAPERASPAGFRSAPGQEGGQEGGKGRGRAEADSNGQD